MRIDTLIRSGLAACLLGALLSPVHAAPPDEKAPQREAETRAVDLVLCLDTSGSMEGLIDAARRKLWAIVNDLAAARPVPRLRVALLAYGGERYDPRAGYVELQTAFTEDLDLVSDKLFGLRAGGSLELVGRVLQTSLRELDWQRDPRALKLIVVAGNESADQDEAVPFRGQCRAAVARGITINALYCVRQEEPDVAAGWRELARLGGGHYAAIDAEHGTIDLASPFDERLAALSQALNATYVPFGKGGREGRRQQTAQDRNASQLSSGVAAQRAFSKSSRLYWNRWCLVDALRRDAVKLEEVKDEDLPEELRGKTLAEKRSYLDAKYAQRTRLQGEIAQLHKEREAWVAEELKKRALDEGRSFDAALKKALRAQARAKGYKFEK